jgi:hypothetical protein
MQKNDYDAKNVDVSDYDMEMQRYGGGPPIDTTIDQDNDEPRNQSSVSNKFHSKRGSGFSGSSPVGE